MPDGPLTGVGLERMLEAVSREGGVPVFAALGFVPVARRDVERPTCSAPGVWTLFAGLLLCAKTVTQL